MLFFEELGFISLGGGGAASDSSFLIKVIFSWKIQTLASTGRKVKPLPISSRVSWEICCFATVIE